MLNHKVSLYTLPLTLLAGAGISYGIMHFSKAGTQAASTAVSDSVATANTCQPKFERVGGHQFTSPLVAVESGCEAQSLTPLKSAVSSVLASEQNQGNLTSASVFIKNLHTGDWMGINEDEKYDPGSLMKVPLMLTYLREEERNPGTLNRQLIFAQPFSTERKPIYLEKGIALGHTYTVNELLKYLIYYSNNDASFLLSAYVDKQFFSKTFTDVGLPGADLNAFSYPISAKEFSLFMEAIYNGSLLNAEHSEMAATLLCGSNFKNGIVKGLPENVRAAHKFGEAGNNNEGLQFHESAIVYLDGSPYLLTIMLRGKDLQLMPGIVANISGIVYNQMKALNKAA